MRTPLLVLAALLASLSLLPAGAAQAAGRKASVTDPVGDTRYDPYEGYVVQGVPAWADLTGASFKVSRSGTLTVVVSVSDLPEGASTPSGRASWAIRGSVLWSGGRKETFTLGVGDSGVAYDFAEFKGTTCKTSTAVDPTTNTVTFTLRLARCAGGAARLKVSADGFVNSSKSSPNPDGSLFSYNRAAYLDSTSQVKLRFP